MTKKILALAITVGLVSGCASFDRNSGLVAGAVIGGAAQIGGSVPAGAVVGGIVGAALGTMGEQQPAPEYVESYAPAYTVASDTTTTSGSDASTGASTDGTMSAADDSYTVMRGDSLWKISGKESIYGNPYHWPLIYKANRDQIRDADLIYPDQVLAIKRDSSQADIDAAVSHARNRGAWSIGTTEAVDTDYLNR